MRSYLVFTPPGSASAGPQSDDSTIVFADGFSWPAFLLPWAWLLWHRLWLAAVVVFLLQIGAGMLSTLPGFEIGGMLLGLSIGLLVGLEGCNYYGRSLARRGFTLETVAFAQDRTTAEAMYFSSVPERHTQQGQVSTDWAKQAGPSVAGWQSPGLGLFDHGAR